MKFALFADLLLDHVLRLVDRIGADRALQIDADRPPAAVQRRIVFDGRRRQLQRLGHFAAIGGQIAWRSPSRRASAPENSHCSPARFTTTGGLVVCSFFNFAKPSGVTYC